MSNLALKAFTTLKAKYEAEIQAIEYDIDVFTTVPTSIPEHASYLETLETLVCKMADAQEKLQVTVQLIKRLSEASVA